MSIEIIENKTRPKVKCPWCQSIIEVDIEPFARNVQHVAKDKCRVCNREVYMAMMVVGTKSLPRMYNVLQKIQMAVTGTTKPLTMS